MALQAVTPDAVLTIPGATATFRVQSNPGGLATSGVLILLGESDQGPAWSQEADLSQNFFGPDELGRAQAKYDSGPLIDAARIATQPANDPDIAGAPTGWYFVKTNVPTKAALALQRPGAADYGSLVDKNWGEPGNLISALIEEAPGEVAPQQAFTYVPVGAGAVTLRLRQNGGAVQSLVVNAQTTPAAFVGAVTAGSLTGLQSLADILATGGVERDVLDGFANTDTLAVAASGNVVTITLGGAVTEWGETPQIGDTLIIPDASDYGVTDQSVIAGGSGQNLGQYIVTSATSTTIVARKIHDVGGPGSVTPPVGVTATAVGSEHADILVYSQVVLQNATGKTRSPLVAANVGDTLVGTASGAQLTLSLAASNWAAQPQINDLLYIPATAPTAWHASGANGGYYRVTASTSSTVTATRLSNGAPASFTATAIAATSDLVCLRPAIDGVGKSLEIYDGGNAVSVASSFYTAAGTAVTWLSTASAPVQTISASELEIRLTAARASQGISEEIVAGGATVLLIGYLGTSATATISANQLTTSVSGGAGANLSVNLKTFRTIGDLVAYIGSQTGYTAAAGNNLLAQAPLFSEGVLTLDQGTYNIGTTHGNRTGRIKRDAWAFFQALRSSSILLQLGDPAAAAAAGLPEAQALRFLSGGTRGATTNAGISAALAACEKLRANFVVPLFSRDAVDDIADGLTDAASDYTFEAVAANTKTHVLKMSTVKAKRNRQAFLGINDTFQGSISAANAMASFRVALAFQGIKGQASDGGLQTMPAWGAATAAAAMQAAGFYRSIMNKGINTSGVVATDSSFDANSDTQVETALLNGLLPARLRPTGGYAWISDQTTYAVDTNFVYNSIQAVYAADLVALTTSQRMERQLVGQSLADVTASTAAALFGGIMADLKRIKLLASSDDAPAGFKNAVFKLVGNTLYVSAEIKIANALAFIPISFTISEVTQTASI